MRTAVGALLILILTSVGLCAEPRVDSAGLPRLGVIIVVDQMTPDYLVRFDSFFVGGLRRLLDNSAVFLGAIHDHAATETAVGHTTISTGSLPSKHGIISNYFVDRTTGNEIYSMLDTLAPLIGRPVGSGVSPVRILAPSLGEQLKAHSPKSQVYAVALKDRSAIGMAGKKADGVYWFDWRNGNFVTSTYYAKHYPAWIDSSNAARQIDSYFADGWNRLLPEEAYQACSPDASPNENDGIHNTFPHRFSDHTKSPDTTYWDEIYATPFADEVTISLAQRAVHYGALGSDETVDLLWISCSAADATGHTYGPLSHEVMDYYLRLDRTLGYFFQYLDSTVGANRYVVALSSDHGVLPMPEDLLKAGIEAGRIHPDTVRNDLKRIGERVAAENGLSGDPIKSGLTDIMLDYSVMTGRNSAALEELLAEELRKLWYVSDVFGRAELLNPSTPPRKYLQKFRNCILPDRGADLYLLTRQGYLIDRDAYGTTHGTAYDYDCIVPILFYGPGVMKGRHEDIIRTVDIAPTIAALLRIKIDSPMDGSIVKLALDL